MQRVAMLGLMGALLQAQPSPADLLRQAEEKIQTEELEPAEALLLQAVRHAPTNTEALYRLGYVQFRLRKLALARSSLVEVLKQAPPAHNSRYFLGRIALLENKPREAIGWLEPVVASGQTSFDAASQLAKAYASAGEPGKAVPVLKTAILQAPWDGALYYRLGQLYRQTGESELARNAFETGTRLKSASREDVETLMRTSELLLAGRPTEAIELSARLLERAATEPNALVALGVIFGNAKLPSEALKAFERAAALDPSLFQAQFNCGLARLKLDRARDAMAPLRRAFELLPQSQEAATTLGLAAVMNQAYAEASIPLELAWKRDPSNLRLGALLGTAYLRSGAAAKAVPILRRVAGGSREDPSPEMLLVEALDSSGDREKALEAALHLQRQFAGIPEAHMTAAQQLVKAGMYEQAAAAFEELLRLVPGQKEAELGLADSLQKSGQHQAALDHYRAAGASPLARLGLARSLVGLKRLEEARKVLEEMLPEYPSDPTLRLELSRVYARLGQPGLAAEQARISEKLRAQ
jgi:tetratricopeptide (TPR) repeat protein